MSEKPFNPLVTPVTKDDIRLWWKVYGPRSWEYQIKISLHELDFLRMVIALSGYMGISQELLDSLAKDFPPKV